MGCSRGVVIKKTDIGEYNQLVTLYTAEFGKVTAIAKSLKKPSSKQAGHLDIFNLTDFLIVPGKNYPIITSAQNVETFSRLKSSLPAISTGFFILEAFNRLVYDHEKDPALWDFLNDSLYKLNEEKEENILDDIKKELLNVLGYSRNLNSKEADYFLESLGYKKFSSLYFADGVLK